MSLLGPADKPADSCSLQSKEIKFVSSMLKFLPGGEGAAAGGTWAALIVFPCPKFMGGRLIGGKPGKLMGGKPGMAICDSFRLALCSVNTNKEVAKRR